MAPDETTTTSAPRFFNEWARSTIFSTAVGSSCAPAAPVKDEEPIFITMRFALVTAVRLIFLCFRLRSLQTHLRLILSLD